MQTVGAVFMYVFLAAAAYCFVRALFGGWRRRCVVCELQVSRWQHRTVRVPGGRAHWSCVHVSDERIRRMVERAR